MKKVIVLLPLVLLAISILAQDTVRTANYMGKTETIEPNEIRILSWNIRMLPRLIFRERIGTMKRARLIPNQVIADQPDIIVFQEAFDVRARRILKRNLKAIYPYKIGPANLKFWRLKTNSGIMIFSKHPLEHLEEIQYNQSDGANSLSRKGALLVEATINGQTFQVMGTHLNAGGSVDLKKSQVDQISDLIERNKKPGVPQLLCGDYNIHMEDPNELELYNYLIDKLNAKNGPLLSEWKFTSGGMHSDVNEKEKKTLIDFILYRGNGVESKRAERYVRIYQTPWAKNHKSLSDHHAVLLKVWFQ